MKRWNEEMEAVQLAMKNWEQITVIDIACDAAHEYDGIRNDYVIARHNNLMEDRDDPVPEQNDIMECRDDPVPKGSNNIMEGRDDDIIEDIDCFRLDSPNFLSERSNTATYESWVTDGTCSTFEHTLTSRERTLTSHEATFNSTLLSPRSNSTDSMDYLCSWCRPPEINTEREDQSDDDHVADKENINEDIIHNLIDLDDACKVYACSEEVEKEVETSIEVQLDEGISSKSCRHYPILLFKSCRNDTIPNTTEKHVQLIDTKESGNETIHAYAQSDIEIKPQQIHTTIRTERQKLDLARSRIKSDEARTFQVGTPKKNSTDNAFTSKIKSIAAGVFNSRTRKKNRVLNLHPMKKECESNIRAHTPDADSLVSVSSGSTPLITNTNNYVVSVSSQSLTNVIVLPSNPKEINETTCLCTLAYADVSETNKSKQIKNENVGIVDASLDSNYIAPSPANVSVPSDAKAHSDVGNISVDDATVNDISVVTNQEMSTSNMTAIAVDKLCLPRVAPKEVYTVFSPEEFAVTMTSITDKASNILDKGTGFFKMQVGDNACAQMNHNISSLMEDNCQSTVSAVKFPQDDLYIRQIDPTKTAEESFDPVSAQLKNYQDVILTKSDDNSCLGNKPTNFGDTNVGAISDKQVNLPKRFVSILRQCIVTMKRDKKNNAVNDIIDDDLFMADILDAIKMEQQKCSEEKWMDVDLPNNFSDLISNAIADELALMGDECQTTKNETSNIARHNPTVE
jgi:hypothetical protein